MGFKAARSAELMNQSLSSSTLSMDRIHEEKFDVEDRLQKVREELEDIKRQNEEYQKNLGLMARVSELKIYLSISHGEIFTLIIKVILLFGIKSNTKSACK